MNNQTESRPTAPVPEYNSFAELSAKETCYTIRITDRNSPVSILAPHGGRIETNTAELAECIASSKYNLYCFLGNRPRKNSRLHLTSHLFDEPQALQLIRASSLVIAIHGCRGTEPFLQLGGLDREFLDVLQKELSKTGLQTCSGEQNQGLHPDNICNRGFRRKGVQLELSAGLRRDTKLCSLLVVAVRRAISQFQSVHTSSSKTEGMN